MATQSDGPLKCLNVFLPDPSRRTIGLLRSLRTLSLTVSSETQSREGFILRRFEGVAVSNEGVNPIKIHR